MHINSDVGIPYRDETMSTGIVVRVYPVPETMLWRLMPGGELEPQVPYHVMETKTGPQERLAKIGDPEWEPYRQAHDLWKRKNTALHTDARLTLALRESEDQPNFDWPESLELPFYLRLLIEDGELEWPKSRTQQRAMWFRSVIAPAADDINLIIDAALVLSGMEEEAVMALRQQFQRSIRDQLQREMALPEDELQSTMEAGEGGDESGQD